MVPMPRGLNLPEGAAVLVLPLEWLTSADVPVERHPTSKAKHRFASEDLIGCHEGDGKAATNFAARSKLRQRAQRPDL